jgi:ferrous-iron efflux pump FieF
VTAAETLPPDAGRLMRRATLASIGVALVLILGKAIAWHMSGSVVVLSSLVDSLLDAVASLVNFMAVRQALVPPDREHRFGHDKFEALAGLAQSLVIAASAFYVLYEAARHLLHPEPFSDGGVALAVMLGSILLTSGLVLYQRSVTRRTGSLAVAADSLHYLSDILTNAGAIAGIVLSYYFGVTLADPVFALGIAFFILMGSRRIFSASLDIVVDRELPDEERRQIAEIVAAHASVISMHDLKTRRAGLRRFVQFHIELDPGMTVKTAHDVMAELDKHIREAFPGANVIIHGDPYGLDEPRQRFD